MDNPDTKKETKMYISKPFVGQSRYTEQINELIHNISKNNASVLITGERGTGKKYFAENVHKSTSANLHNFLVLNCRLDDNQISGFLSKIASIEDSENNLQNLNIVNELSSENRYTVFAENVNFLSLENQKKLLDTVKVCKKKNIRFFSSCEVDLEAKVNTGAFNQDLYSHISSIVLNFAPLRNRKEDILPIAENYISYFVKKSGIQIKGFSSSAKELMENYYWPGNIDELINAIQRAFIISKNEIINSDDLGISRSFNVSDMINESELPDKSLKSAIDEFKKEYVTRILEENGWNQTKTARILGIQRTYVIRLINELQIRRN